MNGIRRWTRRRSNGDGRTEMAQRDELDETMRPIMNLRRRIDRVFQEFFDDVPTANMPSMMEQMSVQPRLDLRETEEAYEISADVPGMTDEDIEISVSDSSLMIRGERSLEESDEDDNYVRRERSYGMFRRRIPLPNNVERGEITANFNNGVLNIELPKTEEARSNWKKIDIDTD